MPNNKHAIIRYHALDRCFSNPGRRYDIMDLLKECNKALMEFDPNTFGIKKRQLYDDIRFMKSEQGWSVDLEVIKDGKDGKTAYYKYENLNYSINNEPINQLEATHLKSAMLVLQRFKGLPQFEWVEELLPKLDQSFSLSDHSVKAMSFDTNEYLKGLEYLSDLFNAIIYKKVLEIEYQSYRSDKPSKLVFHPYHLKQYNKRWFLFGKNKDYDNITNLALDRIEGVKERNQKYLQNENIDFEEYFGDIVGVTFPEKGEVKKIEFYVSGILGPYIQTKPIHESQTPLREYENGYTFYIKVIPNIELENAILGYGEGLKVLAPEEFKHKIINRIKENLNNYS